MPASLWSGNLRLSLVLIPVKMHSAISMEDAVSFRMIHEPTGKPIKYVKGVIDGDEFTEVPEEEIVKGYEHAKGHHVLIHPEELDQRSAAVPIAARFVSPIKMRGSQFIGRSLVTRQRGQWHSM